MAVAVTTRLAEPASSVAENLRPTRALIDLNAVRHNIGVVRRGIGMKPRIMAVVKANAYGHGMVPVARAAVQAGATALGVATADEGLALRESEGFADADILVMSPTLAHEADAMQGADVGCAVGSLELLKHHLDVAHRAGRRARVHVQVETGIGRDGIRFDEPEWINLAAANADHIAGIFTHFAVADGIEADQIAFTNLQCDRFEAVVAQARSAGVHATIHAANSGAILRHPRAHYDMVRPGIMIYGIEPSDMPELCPELRPVLSLRSAIASLRMAEPGDTISYGRTWTAQQPTLIGIVPAGYGDGYLRQFSNRAEVLVRGRRVPVRGRVCMDQFMIDLSTVPEAGIGDEVVLYGAQGAGSIRAEEAARLAGTIGYEITCLVTQRVPRSYVE